MEFFAKWPVTGQIGPIHVAEAEKELCVFMGPLWQHRILWLISWWICFLFSFGCTSGKLHRKHSNESYYYSLQRGEGMWPGLIGYRK